MKRMIFYMMAAVLLFAAACNDDDVVVTGLMLNPSNLTLKVGETKTLGYTITPEKASDKKVVWASDRDAIATVSATGEVTGMAEGKTTITATMADSDLMDFCFVTVEPAE